MLDRHMEKTEFAILEEIDAKILRRLNHLLSLMNTSIISEKKHSFASILRVLFRSCNDFKDEILKQNVINWAFN